MSRASDGERWGEASWRALGTGVQLLVTDDSALVAAERAVREVLDRVDRTFSRFRPDSELVALNAAAGRRVRVTELLVDAIAAALRAAEATAGAVDPTVGHALRLLGYDRDYTALASGIPPSASASASAPSLAAGSSAPRSSAPPVPRSPAPPVPRSPAPPAPSELIVERVPGWRTVELDRAGRWVRIPPRVELDLGSTGKALAADLAAAAAHRVAGVGVLVNLGGDIAIAGAAPQDGWPIHCTDDSTTDPTTDGEVIDLRADAVATSSTTVRRWTKSGVVRHHIVDPWTGLPAVGPWRTATVIAATCVDANAASTAAIVLGERAAAWLEERGLPARLVADDGTVTRVAGWPAPIGAAA